jgi:hypothetical protein
MQTPLHVCYFLLIILYARRAWRYRSLFKNVKPKYDYTKYVKELLRNKDHDDDDSKVKPKGYLNLVL